MKTTTDLKVNMILFLLLLQPSRGETPASGFLLENVRMLDAEGDHGVHTVLVRGDRIAELDPNNPPPEMKRYDGSGKTLLPGLIDSHVHVTMIPGEIFLDYSESERIERHARDLRSYLAWGVTTIVDPGITPEDVGLIRKLSPGPELQVIGPILGPGDGYPGVVTKIPGVTSTDDILRRIDDYQRFKPLGIKITFENGHFGDIWPLFDATEIEAIQQGAERHDMNLYVHAMDKEMTREALKLKPHTLVHASKDGGGELAREIVEAGSYVISTLSCHGAPLLLWDRNMLLPNVSFTVPPNAIQVLYDEEIQDKIADAFVEVNIPYMPVWMTSWGFNETFTKMFFADVLDNFRLLHEADVKLVLGSDSGGWPMFTQMLHGLTTHLEIDFMAQAGMDPMDVIRAATLRPAEMLGLDREIGLLTPGLRADLLIVDGDPLKDIGVLHSPVWVVRNGEIRTPREWMESE